MAIRRKFLLLIILMMVVAGLCCVRRYEEAQLSPIRGVITFASGQG